jgi:nicotinamidase-related amidase
MKALLLIDLQNDYFPGGKFPLWNTDATLSAIETAIAAAQRAGMPVIHIQHVANPTAGPAPFFNPGTPGADIHPRIMAAAPDAPVVVKQFADSFVGTRLEEVLSGLAVTELLV